MKIAIIGAGFTGLSAAYELIKKGHKITIFEKDSQPGGLAIGYQEKGWHWTLESFYHHWFTNDKEILSLAKELDVPVVIKRPKTSHLIDEKIFQLDSPLTLLTFKNLSIRERLQMGLVLAFLRFNPFWKPLEKVTAAKFLAKTIGQKAYKTLWEPLLVGKFGNDAQTISLAWFWARIAKRTTSLAYPEGGFLHFANELTARLKRAGGVINFNTEMEQISEKDGQVSLGKYGIFDKVIVTTPSFTFVKLAPQLPKIYQSSLMSLKGLGAVSLIIRLKKPFFSNNTYWLSICDTSAPALAIVEHTNFMDKKKYNNEHLLYIGHYVPKNHSYLTMEAKELLKTFDPLLNKINPNYKKEIIGFKKFSVPFSQPIIPVNYSRMIPPMTTPIKNVYLANMQQVYPWDRGTNYAVALGKKVAKLIN